MRRGVTGAAGFRDVGVGVAKLAVRRRMRLVWPETLGMRRRRALPMGKLGPGGGVVDCSFVESTGGWVVVSCVWDDCQKPWSKRCCEVVRARVRAGGVRCGLLQTRMGVGVLGEEVVVSSSSSSSMQTTAMSWLVVVGCGALGRGPRASVPGCLWARSAACWNGRREPGRVWYDGRADGEAGEGGGASAGEILPVRACVGGRRDGFIPSLGIVAWKGTGVPGMTMGPRRWDGRFR